MIAAPVSSFLVAAVAISMLLTPLLLVAADRWWIPLLVGQQARRRRPRAEASRRTTRSIIAGFGRYGQIVGRMLFANGITPTVLDHDAEAIEALRQFGWRVYYGDATRLDLMRTAGADKARVIVLAIDDIEQSVECARMLRENFPDATIVARARNVQHYYELHELGVHADRARDARLGADERAQRARAARLAAAPGAEPGAALSPPQRRPAGGDGAAPQGRGAPDRRRQAGPPAARGAVRDRAPAGGASARRAPAGAKPPSRRRTRRNDAPTALGRRPRSFDPAGLLERQARAAREQLGSDRRGRGCR